MKPGARAAAAAAALAPLPFLAAARAGFLNWDDRANLVDNRAYRGFSAASLRWMWTTHFRGPWQPLSWLSYALDRALWGLNAPAMRLTNLALHAAAAGIFALVARRVLDSALSERVPARARELGAFAAACAFALHPLRVESVVWLTERRDVLSGLFFMAAWLAYLDGKRFAALAAFAAALLSKGTATILPVYLLACESYPLGRLRQDPGAAARRLAPFFVLALLAGAMNLRGLGADLQVPWIGWRTRLAIAAHAPGFYLIKTIWPAGLSPYYPLLSPPSRLAAHFALYALVGLAATSAAWRARAPWAWTAWAAFLAALAPVSGLFQNGAQIAADRYTYLPSLPLFLIFGGVVARSASRWFAPSALVSTVLIVVLSSLSWRQSLFWRDDRALWTRAVALAPDGYLPRANLAAADLAAGDSSAALSDEREVLRLRPDDFDARLNAGVLCLESGELDEAQGDLRAALALRPDSAEAAVDLANVLSARGDRRGALDLLDAAVHENPAFAPAQFNRGLILRALGRKAEGDAQLKAALTLDPSLAARLRRAAR